MLGCGHCTAPNSQNRGRRCEGTRSRARSKRRRRLRRGTPRRRRPRSGPLALQPPLSPLQWFPGIRRLERGSPRPQDPGRALTGASRWRGTRPRASGGPRRRRRLPAAEGAAEAPLGSAGARPGRRRPYRCILARSRSPCRGLAHLAERWALPSRGGQLLSLARAGAAAGSGAVAHEASAAAAAASLCSCGSKGRSIIVNTEPTPAPEKRAQRKQMTSS